MALLTILADGRKSRANAAIEADRVRIPPEDLHAALGWEAKPEGLCKDGLCVPTAGRRDFATADGVALADVAALLGRPLASDLARFAVAFGPPPGPDPERTRGLPAPDAVFRDLRGRETRLSDLRGKKVLLVAWASWCGCREELPGWRALHEEMKDRGLVVVTVSLDRRPEDARPFIEGAGASHPSLLDPEHRAAEALGIVNVPTALWIDEAGRVVRPNEPAFATPMFRDFHGFDSESYLDAVRAWVLRGETPPEARDDAGRGAPLTADQRLAKAEGALAFHLLEIGEPEAAERRFARAAALSPFDWTIRRGSMPLRGLDPFGTDFFPLWQEFEAAGKPYYPPRK